MRIPLDQIQEPGLRIPGAVTDAWVVSAAASLRRTPGAPALDPHDDEAPVDAQIQLVLNRLDDHVVVTGEAAVTVLCSCDRCGCSVRMHLHGPVDMHYNPPGDLIEDTDHGLNGAQLDVGWHDGQAINLCSVLMEQLNLWVPDVVRCGEPGITPVDLDQPCELPTGAREEGTATRNPFAGLRVPE
jgi:uncharacterized metal-binding protein YceD (DUF177 family)